MATQKFTIAMVGGSAAGTMKAQFQAWASRRLPLQGKALWSSGAWAPKVRKLVDEFAGTLQKHCSAPPVLYFAEWVDTWSSGNWLQFFDTEPDGVLSAGVAGQRFEVFWHCLPDDGRLKNRGSRAPQFVEDAWLQQRFLEAIDQLANTNVERGILILLREVIDSSVLDEDVHKGCTTLPEWVSDICRDAPSSPE